MGKKCCVKDCEGGPTLFRVPKYDENLFISWRKVILKACDVALRKSSYICDKHFTEKDIHDETIIKDVTGKVIFQRKLSRRTLNKNVIPSIFGDKIITPNKYKALTTVTVASINGKNKPVRADKSLSVIDDDDDFQFKHLENDTNSSEETNIRISDVSSAECLDSNNTALSSEKENCNNLRTDITDDTTEGVMKATSESNVILENGAASPNHEASINGSIPHDLSNVSKHKVFVKLFKGDLPLKVNSKWLCSKQTDPDLIIFHEPGKLLNRDDIPYFTKQIVIYSDLQVKVFVKNKLIMSGNVDSIEGLRSIFNEVIQLEPCTEGPYSSLLSKVTPKRTY